MVAPALFAVVLRVQRERALLLCHFAVGAVFAGIQLSVSFASLWSSLMGLVGFPWTIVSDPTDLLALPFLLVSWRFLKPVMLPVRPGWTRQAAETLLAALGMLACVATSDEDPGYDEPPPPPGCVDTDNDSVCADIDCDDTDPTITIGCCVDADLDGICQEFDCDDQDASIWEDCDLACHDAIDITAGTTSGDTSYALDLLTTSCALPPKEEGHHVGAEQAFGYVVDGESDVLQLVTASVTAARPHALAVRTACASVDSELVCEPQGDEIQVLVASGSTLWLVVEALSVDDQGPFGLTVSQAPVVCGDGALVWPEECDDGNLEVGDGCDADCFLEEEPQP
jgi:cysteine-rich repeat protein